MNRNARTLTMALVLALGLALVAGCSDDTITVPGGGDETTGAPQLPPQSTMKIELDFFGIDTPQFNTAELAKTTPAEFLESTAAGDHTNWINAYVRAIWTHLLIYDLLEEPVGAFALAIHSVPQQQEDGSWLWTYIFVEDNVEYSIFLYGTPMTDRVLWRMEVSTNDLEAPLDHLVWFEGEVMKDDSNGYWQFYDLDGSDLLRIDWENLSAVEHRLALTVNGEGHEDEGDTVEFYESATMGSITYYDASELLESEIVWYADGSGSLTVPDYNDGLRACWDQMQVNTACE